MHLLALSIEKQNQQFRKVGGKPSVNPLADYLTDQDDFDDCDDEINGGDEDEEWMVLGCLFPEDCLMPGEHYKHECHTVEMMKTMTGEK